MNVTHTFTRTQGRRSSGFTLMEMMLVLGIIGILLTVGVVTMTGVMEDADRTKVKADLRTIETCLLRYRTANLRIPTQSEGLEALVTAPGSAKVKRQFLKEEGIMDPWGTTYQFRNPGKKNANYDVFSMGPDKKEGTEDDIYID